ncbi:metalloregulator ArsR/SmtB family transcription factor [Roseivivax sp. CAU 1761]
MARHEHPDGFPELREKAEYVSKRLAAMAHPSRLLIMCVLAEGEISVGNLQPRIGISQSLLSQHLARLRNAEMVATRREAQTIYYRLADAEVEAMMAALYETFCAAGRTTH